MTLALTKEHSTGGDPRNKVSKHIQALVVSNSSAGKSKGNAVTPYSLEDAFMDDQDENGQDRTGSVLHGDDLQMDKQWSVIPPPSLNGGADGANSADRGIASKNTSNAGNSSQN
jgi:hypothetical protein